VLTSGLVGLSEQDRISEVYPSNKRVKKIPDDDAFSLVSARAHRTGYGRDAANLARQRSWFFQVMFYIGLHNIDSAASLPDLDINFEIGESGYVANHIFRIVLSNVSKKSKARPFWDVLPNSPDFQDQESAKVAKVVLDHFYEEAGMKKYRAELAFWTEVCGTSFMYVDWNQDAGKVSRVYKGLYGDRGAIAAQNLLPREKNLLEQMGSYDESAEGNWDVECLGPFNVMLPDEYVYLEKMPWVLIKRIVPLDWVWDRYPKKAPNISADEIGTDETDEYLRRLPTLTKRSGFSVPTRGGPDDESVMIRELWVAPSGRFPNGAKIVTTTKQLLSNEEHPYKKSGIESRFPLVDFHHARVPGSFWSMGTVEHLIGPQREYNRARTQVMEQRDTVSHAQWLAPKEAELDNTENEYGSILLYSGMYGKPELVQPPSLSQAHVATIQDSLNDMERISANSQASMGEVPTGLRSGAALRALQEKDMEVAGPTIENIEHGSQKVGTHALLLFHAYASAPRAIRMYGKSRQLDVALFKGADLRGNTTVRVRQGSMMPKSRAATESTLMDLIGAGAIMPAQNPKDRRLVFEALEVGDMDALFLEEDLDRRRAQHENQKFLKPPAGPETAMAEVMDWDDHQAHLEEHLKFLKTDSYERLPPFRKLMIQAHVQKHYMAVAQMLQAQAMWQGMGSGGGGSPPAERGQPSPPRDRQPTPGSESRNGTAA